MGNKLLYFFTFVVAVGLILLPASLRADVVLDWDASPEPELKEYRLYYASESPVTTSDDFVTVDKATPFHIFDALQRANVDLNENIYFAVSAVDTEDNESGLSNEVSSIDTGVPTDTDSDGLSDADEVERETDPFEEDSDDDGLQDGDEVTRGSNPNATDSDNDGVNDGQEVADGSNPTDRGSNLPVLGNELCTEWNGFFNMWNILEHVNLSDQELNLEVQFYTADGQATEPILGKVEPGRQLDLLIHSFEERLGDSIGKVCSRHDGQPGDMDGRMVHYMVAPEEQQPLDEAPSKDFSFAFAMPMTNGIKGNQFVPFNTFQPSLNPEHAEYLVANWIQVTNLNDSAQSGSLIFYGFDGSVLDQQDVTLAPGARQDFGAHQLGPWLIGLVEWRPTDADAGFQVRNIRYLYDNEEARPTFFTAFQLEASVGSSAPLSAPLDTRYGSSIIELSNTANTATTVSVTIYSEAGEVLETQPVSLAPYASFHLITDTIVEAGLGTASIVAEANSSIIATVMQYNRSESMAIHHMYGLKAAESLGSVIRGSYNTFIGQESELWIVNDSDSEETVSISATRYDGTEVIVGESRVIPARGVSILRVNDFEPEEAYGVITVTPTTPGSVSATVLRRKAKEYTVPTPVRQ